MAVHLHGSGPLESNTPAGWTLLNAGPSLSANGSDAETLKVSAVVEHPTAALQMLFLKSCAARAKPVALAKSDASLRKSFGRGVGRHPVNRLL